MKKIEEDLLGMAFMVSGIKIERIYMRVEYSTGSIKILT
jgi:hypothetical protein